jgi:ABC-type phosphate/phosphonate transport system substrate-binding protein
LDAILALNFRQIDVAIISQYNYQILMKKYPNSFLNIKTWNISNDFPTPILYQLKNRNDIKVKNLFLNMNKNEIGKKFLEIIGIKKWQNFSEK